MKAKKGPEAFNEFYQKIYGDRWPSLKESLLGLKQYTVLTAPSLETNQKWCYELALGERRELKETEYAVDSAALELVNDLKLKEGESFLDLCASPGGKALAFVYQSHGKAIYHLNELSSSRKARLVRTFKKLEEIYKLDLEIWSRDGRDWGRWRPDSYDKVLLDAPCGSERHLLEGKGEIEHWKEKRGKKLSKTQMSLCASAFDSLRHGGTLCYSTCSLSPLENQEVIRRLLERRSNAEIVQTSSTKCDPLEFGQIILPDKFPGRGPLYWCLIRKL